VRDLGTPPRCTPPNGHGMLIVHSQADQPDPAAINNPCDVTTVFATASTAGGHWLATGHAL